MELNKLLRPQKIVIVGATERETMAGFASRMFLEQCRERMEDLYLVSLKNDRVFGVPCYRKISDIPGKIDLAVICTPKTTVPALLEEAAEQGAKGAVVFASGYGETKLPEDVRMDRLKWRERFLQWKSGSHREYQKQELRLPVSRRCRTGYRGFLP